ncbi:MAG: hypothetical protein QM784_31600 [Polyangiaceae bacterium]
MTAVASSTLPVGLRCRCAYGGANRDVTRRAARLCLRGGVIAVAIRAAAVLGRPCASDLGSRVLVTRCTGFHGIATRVRIVAGRTRIMSVLRRRGVTGGAALGNRTFTVPGVAALAIIVRGE